MAFLVTMGTGRIPDHIEMHDIEDRPPEGDGFSLPKIIEQNHFEAEPAQKSCLSQSSEIIEDYFKAKPVAVQTPPEGIAKSINKQIVSHTTNIALLQTYLLKYSMQSTIEEVATINQQIKKMQDRVSDLEARLFSLQKNAQRD